MPRGTCWKGYVQKGFKKKGNRSVPNCVAVQNAQTGKSIKKLLSGGLLSKSMRMAVKASQKIGSPKIGEMTKENVGTIKTAKSILEDKGGKDMTGKLGDEVTQDLARTMARAEKSDKYSRILNRAKSDPKATPSIKKDLDKDLSKLSEYGKNLREQAKAIIDKDVEKPLLQSKGGLIKGYPKLAKKGWK
jgi:hypothetical protein